MKQWVRSMRARLSRSCRGRAWEPPSWPRSCGRPTNPPGEAVLAPIEGDTRKALATLDRGCGQIIGSADRAERFAAIAERYAALDKAGRARALVMEPSRKGRNAWTADIRAALTQSDALTGPFVAVESLSIASAPGRMAIAHLYHVDLDWSAAVKEPRKASKSTTNRSSGSPAALRASCWPQGSKKRRSPTIPAPAAALRH